MKNIKKEKLASEFLLKKTSFGGNTAIILGSGLGEFPEILTESKILSYKKIPYFPNSNVEGHQGQFVVGNLFDKELLIARGRVHCYEGYSRERVAFPIKVLKECGIKNLIITNSSGSLDKKNPPGTIMNIIGHIDCTFQDNFQEPLLNNDEKYHAIDFIKLSNEIASENKIKIISGNYCWVLGPAYETPEEIKYFKLLNGTAIGMSTLPEIKEAGNLGIRVLSLALLTNYAAGITDEILTHKDVLKIAEQSKFNIIKLLSGIIERI